MFQRMCRMVGNDPEFAYFTTPSSKTPSLVYDQIVYKLGDGEKLPWHVSCNCFGANRWKKFGNLKHPETSDPCVHIHGLMVAFSEMYEV